eukprot:317876_1
MNRKVFAKQMVTEFNNNKLNLPFCKLYTAITKYDLAKFADQGQTVIADFWSNKPQSVTDCNLNQIVYILNQDKIFQSVGILTDSKSTIINYVQDHGLDGQKLSEMGRKIFASQIIQHLGNKKLLSKYKLVKLYDKIMEFDILNEFAGGSNKHTNYTKKMFYTHHKSSKFVTAMTRNEEQIKYYAFGKQYRYTVNLAQHPLYVRAKYNSIKMELFQYYKSLHENGDKNKLLNTQLQTVKKYKFNYNFKRILEQLILGSDIQQECLNHLWIGLNELNQIQREEKKKKQISKPEPKPEEEKNTNVDSMMNVAVSNYQFLYENIINLFAHLSSVFILTQFLPFYIDMVNNRIQQNLNRYFQNMESKKFTQLSKKINGCLKEKSVNSIWNIVTETYKDIFKDDSDYYEYHIEPYLLKISSDNLKLIKPFNVQQQTVVADKLYQMMAIDQTTMSEMFPSDDIHKLLRAMSKEMCQTNKILDDMKQKFVSIASTIIQSSISENRKEYVEYQNTERCRQWIEKAAVKSKMNSVKQMKAVWYHGINQAHQIHVNTPLSDSEEHIIALLCYTHDSE